MINYLRRNTCALLAGAIGVIALDIDGEWTSELISLVLVVVAIVLGITQGEQEERRRGGPVVKMTDLSPGAADEVRRILQEEMRRHGSR